MTYPCGFPAIYRTTPAFGRPPCAVRRGELPMPYVIPCSLGSGVGVLGGEEVFAAFRSMPRGVSR